MGNQHDYPLAVRREALPGQAVFFKGFLIFGQFWLICACCCLNAKSGMGNLQGIAGHIARMIFSAGHIYVSCAKGKKRSSENLMESKKKGHHVRGP